MRARGSGMLNGELEKFLRYLNCLEMIEKPEDLCVLLSLFSIVCMPVQDL